MKSPHNQRAMKAALIACGLLASAFTATSVFAASGQFTYVTGGVSVQRGGVQIPASNGMEVNPGDVVITTRDSYAQLSMVDNAKLSLRANSRLLIEQYPQNATGAEGAVLSLVRGTLRAFTAGLNDISRSKYKMQTRVATVGIRGSGNIMNQSEDDTTTTNHTIEGSHIVESRDGNFVPVITNPNQTVQVVLGQAPKIIPTPPSLLDAGRIMTGSGSSSTGAANANDQPPGQNTQNPNPVVGGNGLGYTLVDATGNLGADPINLQSIGIAMNGTAFTDQAVPGQMVLENGALRSYTAYAGGQSGTSLSINGGTPTDLQTITIGGSTTIVLGRYTNVSSVSFSGGAGAVNGGGVHFGYAGAGFPSYLSDVLTGTVSYTRAGATAPTNQFGTLGQLTNSVLDVNFTARTLNATLGITMPASSGAGAGSWTMQATNVPFALNSFLAFTGGGRLVVTNGSGQSSATTGNLNGTIEGSFVGATLNGALLGYGLVDQTSQSFQSISGVVAFSGKSQNAAAQFRDGLISDPNNALAVASYIRSYATTNRPEEVTIDAQGRATAFAGPYVNGSQLAGHLAYGQGTSTIADSGFDATTGLSWGRWSGGSATIGGQTSSLANASLHYIFGATQSGPVSLPLTGTATYDVVGSTRPTDMSGHVGTLNSATLDANFTAKTVNASVNIAINGQTWNGSASNVPIYRDQYFSAYGGTSIAGVPRPSAFVMTCAPNCTPSIPTGSLDGFFTGGTGRGAGVMYNMNGNAGAVAFARRGG